MRARVKAVNRWEEGKPTAIPPDAKIRAHSGGERPDSFFTTVYVDDYLLVRVQHTDDKTALIPSTTLACDHVRLFGPGEEGVTPILASKKNTDWDTTIDALEFTTVNWQTVRTPIPREEADEIKKVAA